VNLSQEVIHSQKRIARLEFEIAVEKAVLERLQALDVDRQPSLFPNHQGQIVPGSMSEHIQAVLTESGKPMKIGDIVDAVKSRGATSRTPDGLPNNVRGTLKRRTDLFARYERGIYRLVKKTLEVPETPGE